jgi:predicted dehydrogenase
VRDALEAGLDVLAEKPFTLTVAEAEDLTRRAAERDRILMVAHTFLFNPSVRQIKSYIRDGTVGDFYYAKARRTHLGLVREDVNAVWDPAPHDVSMFLLLLEESPLEVQAVGRRVLRRDREDAAFVNLAFPSGVIAQLSVSWADSNKERYLDIVGSKSRVAFDDLNVQEPIRIFYKGIAVEGNPDPSFGEFKYLLRDGDILSPKVTAQEPLRVLCDEFVAALTSRVRPFSDAAFGTRVVDVLCRIEAALRR